MASFAYPRGKAILLSTGDWARSSVSFGALLATSEYVPGLGHKRVSDVWAELRGGGYGRRSVEGREVLESDGGRVDCMADALEWEGLSSRQSYRWVVLFRDLGSDQKSDLIVALDMTRVDLDGIVAHRVRWDSQPEHGRVFSLA